MAREIIDLTRSPSTVDRKPDLQQLRDVDRKPVIVHTPTKAKPLGPAKRVAAVSTKRTRSVVPGGKTPVVKREVDFAIKQEMQEGGVGAVNLAFDSLSLKPRDPINDARGGVASMLLPKATYSFLSDSEDEATVPVRASATVKPPLTPSLQLKIGAASSPLNVEEKIAIHRTPARTPRRYIRDPDSDTSACLSPSPPASPSPLATRHRTPSPVVTPPKSSLSKTAGTRARTRETPIRPQPAKREIRKYLDLYAGTAGGRGASSEEESDEDDGEGSSSKGKNKRWMARHYDDSLGSLKDFIVPDDYESTSASEDEEGGVDLLDSEDDEVEVIKPVRKPKREKSRDVTEEALEVMDDMDDVVAIVEDEHLLHFSPPSRPFTLPDLGVLSLVDSDDSDDLDTDDSDGISRRHRKPTIPTTPSRKTKPSSTPKTVKGKTPSKKAWASERAAIAQDIFDELDRKVFDRRLGAKGAGAVIEWSKRLLTTAGQAHTTRTRHTDGTKTEKVKIILSDKVLTGEEQILSTVAHEMCHVASWVISDERKNPHGRVFKSWGAKVMRARPDIEVTTKHSYEIEYKYSWRCTGAGCNKVYKRHSKSIDTTKQRCGKCRGVLEPMWEQRESSAFQMYLKAHMADAKASMPGEPHAAVMRALSARWKEGEGQGDAEVSHAVYWKGMARAARS